MATNVVETCIYRRLTIFIIKYKILLNDYIHLLVSSLYRISLMHGHGLFKTDNVGYYDSLHT